MIPLVGLREELEAIAANRSQDPSVLHPYHRFDPFRFILDLYCRSDLHPILSLKGSVHQFCIYLEYVICILKNVDFTKFLNSILIILFSYINIYIPTWNNVIHFFFLNGVKKFSGFQVFRFSGFYLLGFLDLKKMI